VRRKVKKLKTHTIIVVKDIPISFGSCDEVRQAGKSCREIIDRELGKRVSEYARITVDWYARKATAKIRVLDCKER
jgi:hypothetical protein